MVVAASCPCRQIFPDAIWGRCVAFPACCWEVPVELGWPCSEERGGVVERVHDHAARRSVEHFPCPHRTGGHHNTNVSSIQDEAGWWGTRWHYDPPRPVWLDLRAGLPQQRLGPRGVPLRVRQAGLDTGRTVPAELHAWYCSMVGTGELISTWICPIGPVTRRCPRCCWCRPRRSHPATTRIGDARLRRPNPVRDMKNPRCVP